MSAGEREPGERWPGMGLLRRWDNRKYRAAVRSLIRQGLYEAVPPNRGTSAKWQVW